MYKFSQKSLTRLTTVDKRLVRLLNIAIQYIDFSILEGHRNETRQQRMYSEGKSKVQFPNSKHNRQPSQAVDIAPYPIDWQDTKRFAYLAGLIKGIAITKGISIRWGGDWDMDGELKDNRFNDLPHIELRYE